MTIPATFGMKERIASACVISIIGGLVIATGAAVSFERTILIWIVFTIAAGLIVGAITTDESNFSLKRTVLPSLALPTGYAGYYAFRAMIESLKGVDPFRELTISMSGSRVPMPYSVMLGTGVYLILATFLATWILMTAATIGSRVLTGLLAKIYEFGPENINKTAKIVASIGGLTAALIAMWAVFASSQ